jgi:hypothetical protein
MRPTLLLSALLVGACASAPKPTTVGSIAGLEELPTAYRDVLILDGAGHGRDGPSTLLLTRDGALEIHGALARPSGGGGPLQVTEPAFVALTTFERQGREVLCLATRNQEVRCCPIPRGGFDAPPQPRMVLRFPIDELEPGCVLGGEGELACFPPARCDEEPQDEDTAALCAQRDAWGPLLEQPEGRFTALAVSGDRACATSAEGTLHCWGGEQPPFAEHPPLEDLLFLGDRLHGLDGEGALVPLLGPAGSPSALGRLPAGGWLDLQVVENLGCGLQRDGGLACFGRPADDPEGRPIRELLRPPEGAFTALALGRQHACAVREDGRLLCWGACAQLGEACPR